MQLKTMSRLTNSTGRRKIITAPVPLERIQEIRSGEEDGE